MALVSAVMASTCAAGSSEGTDGRRLGGICWSSVAAHEASFRVRATMLMLIFIPLDTTFSARDWTNFLFAMCTSKSFFNAS